MPGAVDDTGVREVRVHDMRHTAGTLLVAQGAHIRAVQDILGHSDGRTSQSYTPSAPRSHAPPSGWASRCGGR